MSASTPVQVQLRASIGSLSRWSRVHGEKARREQLAPANTARMAGWRQQAIDNGAVTEDEIAAAVDLIQRAHYRRMALASVASRRRTSRDKAA